MSEIANGSLALASFRAASTFAFDSSAGASFPPAALPPPPPPPRFCFCFCLPPPPPPPPPPSRSGWSTGALI
ncbi:unnamed protein product [Rotaria magnacalcarata]|uniref:Uncharacterized protein n=1 Tax=Rotaria magnacalcarata TaxID=392030 RepID=A0A815MG85_9BILA|nr:unnamed protein product [Rotaria magnacalcarata]